MLIEDYFELPAGRQAAAMKQLKTADWAAGESLCRRIEDGSFFSKTGDGTKLLLLIDEESGQIASYCTLAEKDDIQPTEKTPWIGYVYTWPAFRHRALMKGLLEYAEGLAAEKGARAVWISTGHEGLYERCGYVFDGLEPDIHGTLSRVYRKDLL